jgi:hypothetical protein
MASRFDQHPTTIAKPLIDWLVDLFSLSVAVAVAVAVAVIVVLRGYEGIYRC